MPAVRSWNFANINVAATGDIVAASATSRFVVYAFALVNGVATAQEVTFRSGTTALVGPLDLPSSIGGGVTMVGNMNSAPLFQTNPGEALNVLLGAATQVDGFVSY